MVTLTNLGYLAILLTASDNSTILSTLLSVTCTYLDRMEYNLIILVLWRKRLYDNLSSNFEFRRISRAKFARDYLYRPWSNQLAKKHDQLCLGNNAANFEDILYYLNNKGKRLVTVTYSRLLFAFVTKYTIANIIKYTIHNANEIIYVMYVRNTFKKESRLS